ncbi:MAG: restriction endonuclease subunit S [Gammaproteobacteria bacterium AqS3]|nr:restriction endonuclease subunit S [Gammaproteobacteria bacterium AqS3]
MNELLTRGIGHTEFKDSELGRIPKSWEIRKIGDVSTIMFSNVDKKTNDTEVPILLCNYMDVYNNLHIKQKIKFMKATATQKEIDKFSLKYGDVIITKDSETPNDIAVPAHVAQEFDRVVCGYHLALIRTDKKQLQGLFLLYLLSLDINQRYFYRLANGSTRFGLTTNSIKNAELTIPPLTEQKKIAAILTSIDDQVSAAREKLSQTQSLKKSLMQDLLTGRVRVST